MKFPKIVLGVSGVIMFGVGVLYLLRPDLLQPGPTFVLDSAPARTEIRAVYGGIELAIGAFLLLCLVMPTWRSPGLAFATLVGLLAGGARIFGWVSEGEIDWKNALWASLEIAGGIVALVALLALRRGPRPPTAPSGETATAADGARESHGR